MSIHDSRSSRDHPKRPLNDPPTRVATVVAVVALIGVATAILLWTGTIGTGGARVDIRTPSFVAGSHYGADHYSAATSQGAVCNSANAPKADDLTQWMQGCHDAWAIASFSSGLRSSGGPIP